LPEATRLQEIQNPRKREFYSVLNLLRNWIGYCIG
jgi:hypothetical protein